MWLSWLLILNMALEDKLSAVSVACVLALAVWIGYSIGWYVFLTVPGIASIIFVLIVAVRIHERISFIKQKRELEQATPYLFVRYHRESKALEL